MMRSGGLAINTKAIDAMPIAKAMGIPRTMRRTRMAVAIQNMPMSGRPPRAERHHRFHDESDHLDDHEGEPDHEPHLRQKHGDV